MGICTWVISTWVVRKALSDGSCTDFPGCLVESSFFSLQYHIVKMLASSPVLQVLLLKLSWQLSWRGLKDIMIDTLYRSLVSLSCFLKLIVLLFLMLGFFLISSYILILFCLYSVKIFQKQEEAVPSYLLGAAWL